MKKFKVAFLAVVCFLTFSIVTNAASKCDYSELAEINQEAAKVKLSYEEKLELLQEGGLADLEDDEITGKPTPAPTLYTRYFMVNISNVTENLYIKVFNSVDNSTKIFTSSDAVNGIISFRWDDIETVANLTIKVYTSQNTKCANEEVLVQQETLPMYNEYSETAYCLENPDESICSQYVKKEVTQEEYERKYNKSIKEATEKEKEERKVTKKVAKIFKKNKKGFIIGGSIIIVLGVATTVVVIVKRRRSRLI